MIAHQHRGSRRGKHHIGEAGADKAEDGALARWREVAGGAMLEIADDDVTAAPTRKRVTPD